LQIFLNSVQRAQTEKLQYAYNKGAEELYIIQERGNTEVTGASISDISYEDILVFQNWKKNVE